MKKKKTKNPNAYDDTYDRTHLEQFSPPTTGMNRPQPEKKETFGSGEYEENHEIKGARRTGTNLDQERTFSRNKH